MIEGKAHRRFDHPHRPNYPESCCLASHLRFCLLKNFAISVQNLRTNLPRLQRAFLWISQLESALRPISLPAICNDKENWSKFQQVVLFLNAYLIGQDHPRTSEKAQTSPRRSALHSMICQWRDSEFKLRKVTFCNGQIHTKISAGTARNKCWGRLNILDLLASRSL